jgi:membrane-bound lytic murein transglycosylase D
MLMLPNRVGSMLQRLLYVIATLFVASVALAADPQLLPRPPELEANVRFWTRIYTEVDSGAGLIHDSENLEVVYEEIRLPDGISSRARSRRIAKIKKRYRAVLQRLARGKRENLSEEEARALAHWPDDVSNATLKRASSRVRFQLGQADKFHEGLIRMGRWSAHIERVLEDHGVPPELVALPHVESSYNPRAYSRVGAAGIWQFTRSTGRLYLRVDHVVDERMDPFASSVGAARLLRDNHRRLESWPLAITAYNHGVAGMARAVRKLGTRDIGTIARRYRSRTFGFASRNFYAEFLAASAIEQEAELYFGVVQPDEPIRYTIVETDHFYAVPSLEDALGIDRELLRDHNLALRPAVWNGAKLVPRGYPLRVPAEALHQPVEVALAKIPEKERIAKQHRDRFHKVRRGETLSRIAQRYGVRQSELVALNNLRSRHRIRAGQVLRLPDDGRTPIVVARRDPPADGIYRVRRGDNLSVISQRFGVAQQDLVKWNRLRNRNEIAVGQRLRVAPPAIVVASAEAPPAEVAPRLAAAPAPAAEPVAQAGAETEAEARADAGALTAAETEEPSEAQERSGMEALLSLFKAADEPEARSETAGGGIDGEERPELGELPPAVSAEATTVPVPDPSNYAVTRDHRVTVQADETLGHYAEWLEVNASRLRRLNGMRYGTPLVIGRQKKLDFSRVTPEEFERRRLEYHRTLQEEFFEAYVVSGTRTHTLRRGDSLWYLAEQKYEVPIWLLRQYNPDLDFGSLPAGTPMVVPIVESSRERT